MPGRAFSTLVVDLHCSVISESAGVWYVVSRAENCVDIALADSAHCEQLCWCVCSMFLIRVSSPCSVE